MSKLKEIKEILDAKIKYGNDDKVFNQSQAELEEDILSDFDSIRNYIDELEYELNQQNQLTKKDIEVKIGCSKCDYGVTDDISDCYCRCTCEFNEDEDYSCIYEEDLDAEGECPRSVEGSGYFQITAEKYESLRDK